MSIPHQTNSTHRDQWIIGLFLGGVMMVLYFPAILNIFLPPLSERILSPNTQSINTFQWRENFATYFISITLEATPYMIMGAFLAALIEEFLPVGLLPRIVGRLGILGVPAVSILALLFPICECGVIVVARRLLKKGLPLPHVLAYLLAAPIVNPIVLFGTYVAFFQSYQYMWLRGIGGFVVAVGIGLLFYRIKPHRILIESHQDNHHHHHHHHHDDAQPKKSFISNVTRLSNILNHVREDFLDMGLYFLLGIILASTMKTLVSADILFSVGEGSISGPASMMFAAFVLSLCSEADAFLAASFVEFDLFAHMAFLVLGPMLDIKLLIMYRTLFKPGFILLFSLTILTGVSLYITALHWIL
ncbi:MAG: permease [Magnetococcales bacterium]|nr:permease [Magnetococcales bacterium]